MQLGDTQVASMWQSGDVLVEVVLCSHLYFCFWKTFTVGCGEQEEGDNCQCPDLENRNFEFSPGIRGIRVVIFSREAVCCFTVINAEVVLRLNLKAR